MLNLARKFPVVGYHCALMYENEIPVKVDRRYSLIRMSSWITKHGKSNTLLCIFAMISLL